MNEPEKVIVQVKRRLTAPRERVFDAWLDPATLGLWMFGRVANESVLHTRTDMRVGGRFSFLVRRGDQEIDHVGTYLEIDRPRRLVFTWAAIDAGSKDDADESSSRVTIEFAAANDGCEVTLTHEMAPAWKDFAERTQHGWTTILDALAAAFDSNRIPTSR